MLTPLHRSIVSVALGLTALTTACAPQDGASPGAQPFTFDLAANLDFAERRAELLEIDGMRFEQRGYLLHGWTFPPPPREGAGPPDGIWSDAEEAQVLFQVSKPQALELKTSVAANTRAGERMEMRILLNGTELGRQKIGTNWTAVELELPVSEQVPGENCLTFEFEYARTRAEVTGTARSSGIRFSARFRPLRLERQNPADAERVAWTLERAPVGVSLRQLSEDSRAIEQASTTSLGYHVEVPSAARFRAHLAFIDARKPDPGPAIFRVIVTPRGGEPEVILEQSVPYRASPVDMDVGLERFAGGLARIALEVEGPTDSAVFGSWIDPHLSGWTEGPGSEAEGAPELRRALRRTPVIAILIDACHAEFISAYGGRPGLTPNIDRLADEGVLFERAHSVACYTMASVSSMLADRYTWEHGTYWESHRLPASFETWPERFNDQGYRTVAIVHSINGSSRVGFERGFDEMVEVYRGRSGDQRFVPFASEILEPLQRVLAEDDGKPLFLWLHLIEPHRPYDPPSPWRGKLSSKYTSTLDGGVKDAARIKNRSFLPSEEDIAFMRALYEENLAYVDSVLGSVRAQLEEEGIFDEAIVCLFSDHGEAFLQHDGKLERGIGHGPTVYQEMNHIPLVLRLPSSLGLAGQRSDALVSGLDILPTLADLVGVGAPPGGRGRSLANMLLEPARPGRQHLVSHSYCPREDRFLAMWGHWWQDYKLVYHSGSRPELFDLSRDPGELDNLAEDDPVLAAYMQQKLQEFVGFNVDRGERGSGPSEEIQVDEEAMQQLRALGYGR